jgi:hypothetical protein
VLSLCGLCCVLPLILDWILDCTNSGQQRVLNFATTDTFVPVGGRALVLAGMDGQPDRNPCFFSTTGTRLTTT